MIRIRSCGVKQEDVSDRGEALHSKIWPPLGASVFVLPLTSPNWKRQEQHQKSKAVKAWHRENQVNRRRLRFKPGEGAAVSAAINAVQEPIASSGDNADVL